MPLEAHLLCYFGDSADFKVTQPESRLTDASPGLPLLIRHLQNQDARLLT